MQKRKLEDAIRMHYSFMLDSYKSVQSKIINNFRKNNGTNTTHIWNGTDMAALKTTCEVNGMVNTINLTEGQDHMNAMEAIPNFIALLNSFSDNIAQMLEFLECMWQIRF